MCFSYPVTERHTLSFFNWEYWDMWSWFDLNLWKKPAGPATTTYWADWADWVFPVERSRCLTLKVEIQLEFGKMVPEKSSLAQFELGCGLGFEGGRENLSLWSRVAQKNKTRNGSDNQRLKDRDSGSGA